MNYPNMGRTRTRTHGNQMSSMSNTANNKIIFLALGAIFGFVLLMFAVHLICAKCFWGRTPATLDDELDETSSNRVERRRRRFRRRRPRRQYSEHPNTSNINGLDKAVVDLLPTFVFNSEAPVRNVTECAVCLAEFADGDQGRLLPKCNHCFHVECIDMWFLSHCSCPLCRCDVSLLTLGITGTDLDLQLPRSLSCPRFYGDHGHLQQQPGPLLLSSSASVVTSFRDLRAFFDTEECPAESSSDSPTRIQDASGSPVQASTSSTIMIPERLSDIYPEISDDAYNLERPSSLPTASPAAAVAIEIEISDESCNSSEDEQVNQQQASAAGLQFSHDGATSEHSTARILTYTQ